MDILLNKILILGLILIVLRIVFAFFIPPAEFTLVLMYQSLLHVSFGFLLFRFLSPAITPFKYSYNRYLIFVFIILSIMFLPPYITTEFELYKVISHLFIGYLLNDWFTNQEKWKLQLFWTMILVEVATAIITRYVY